ncbi:hypothetical protein GCM10023185_46160 [Hymenobacter saemangeumensis]|uniref:Uncharacterized protein n=1 Tax=Hymenobacter saemangeumensis TaxID=1084522 RepID=A0ABP8ISW3_9BACT
MERKEAGKAGSVLRPGGQEPQCRHYGYFGVVLHIAWGEVTVDGAGVGAVHELLNGLAKQLPVGSFTGQAVGLSGSPTGNQARSRLPDGSKATGSQGRCYQEQQAPGRAVPPAETEGRASSRMRA